jgi:hypothetical protein
MKKTKLTLKNALLLLIVLLGLKTNAQTMVTKTLTIKPFIDANNNCTYDMGEDTIVNFGAQGPLYTFVSSIAGVVSTLGFNSACNGLATATVSTPLSSLNYTLVGSSPYLQSCGLLSVLPYNTIINVPYTNATNGVFVSSGFLGMFTLGSSWNSNSNNMTGLVMDTIRGCSGTSVLTYSLSLTNATSCSITSSLTTMSIKLNAATIYSTTLVAGSGLFTGSGVFGNYSNVANFGNYYIANNNVYLSAGIHTLSIVFNGFTSPFTIKKILVVDSCGSITGSTYADCNNN